MELGIKTIATAIMLLVVLLVVGIYFTRGAKLIYGRAGEFDEKATGGSDVAGGIFKQTTGIAWYGCPAVGYPPIKTVCEHITKCGEYKTADKQCACVATGKYVCGKTALIELCEGTSQKLYDTQAACNSDCTAGGCSCKPTYECRLP